MNGVSNVLNFKSIVRKGKEGFALDQMPFSNDNAGRLCLLTTNKANVIKFDSSNFFHDSKSDQRLMNYD